MSGWLVDTNIISELRRPRPNRKVVEFIENTPISKLYLCTVSLAEIRKGISSTADPAKRASLGLWLANELQPMFEWRILAATEDVLLQSLLIIDIGRKRRHNFKYPDILIAATAIQHGLTIVTRNVRDFEAFGAEIHDPWTSD